VGESTEKKDDYSKTDDNLLLSLFEDVVINLFDLARTTNNERKMVATSIRNNVRAEILKRLQDKTRALMESLTKEKIEAGNRAASEMMTASIQKALGGVGGCEILNMNKFEFKNIIKRYLDKDIDSVTGIWLAMEGGLIERTNY